MSRIKQRKEGARFVRSPNWDPNSGRSGTHACRNTSQLSHCESVNISASNGIHLILISYNYDFDSGQLLAPLEPQDTQFGWLTVQVPLRLVASRKR